MLNFKQPTLPAINNEFDKLLSDYIRLKNQTIEDYLVFCLTVLGEFDNEDDDKSDRVNYSKLVGRLHKEIWPCRNCVRRENFDRYLLDGSPLFDVVYRGDTIYKNDNSYQQIDYEDEGICPQDNGRQGFGGFRIVPVF